MSQYVGRNDRVGDGKAFPQLQNVLPKNDAGLLQNKIQLALNAGDEFGVLNVLFGLTDPPFQWLGDKTIAFWAIVIINTWRYYGITMVIYLVNMSAVP